MPLRKCRGGSARDYGDYNVRVSEEVCRCYANRQETGEGAGATILRRWTNLRLGKLSQIRTPSKIDQIAAQLQEWSFVSIVVEGRLQYEVRHVLNALKYKYQQEHRLDARSRVDFYLPEQKIGIEVKTAGSPSKVMKQIQRYNECDQIKGMILITSRSRHTDIPEMLAGKPVRVVFIGGIR